MEQTLAPPPPPSSSCWSSILKAPAPPKPQASNDVASTQNLFVQSCKSSKGIAVAVVDANAIIEGGDRISSVADRFVSVPQVIAEVRDPVARRRLEFMPFSVDTMEPTPEALDKVVKFARATGDLQTLSDVDLKLIALTYTLEAQIHGTSHLRDCPPPVHTVNVKRLPEKDMPGWGSNVPNLEEWEALEHEADSGSNNESRILPLKDLNLNIPANEIPGDGSTETKSDVHSESYEHVDGNFRKPRRYPPKKVEVKIEGKKMVADGIDASQGQFDDDAGDWRPAVSRSTHRRYLRRKARREYNEALLEKECQEDAGQKEGVCPEVPVQQLNQSVEEELSANATIRECEVIEGISGGNSLSSSFEQMRLEEVSLVTQLEGHGCDAVSADMECSLAAAELMSNDAFPAFQVGNIMMNDEKSNHLEISSQTDLSVDASYIDDESSEQSWMLRSLSESTVACVTSDFAMQNVILQMGLRLLAPGGMQIRQLHRWILKCHACYTVTAEIGRIFCPKCGNGGTLRKVAVTVNENGVVVAGRRPRITLRGTKFSLPLPQGGRDAISKNLILREDQLPQKYLCPKNKKKQNKEGDNFFPQDDIFIHHTDKRAPFQPPVRKALAVFSGKRNPNDNHFSRSKRK